MKQIFALLLFFISTSLVAQKATEVRAVWLTTNWELDLPSSKLSEAKQKAQLSETLDELRRMNINTVLFQARLRGDTFYKSEIEPFSPHYKWSKNSDMLSFVIEECHKRGIDCHAWFVAYPLGSKNHARRQKESIVNRQPNICKLHKGEWYLDPGNPEAQKYLLTLVDEIVSKYDVDGIHFDYIRYPDDSRNFPDKDSFTKHNKGFNLEDWRRNNITQFVERAYNLVKSKKPWVLVSSSPIGKYRNINASMNEWTGYDNVYQDAVLWLKEGIHDAVFPMLYHKEKEFETYLQQWVANSGGKMVIPGIGIYKLDGKEGDWDASEISRQIAISHELHAEGQAFYRVKNLTSNLKNIKNTIQNNYKYPAKLPPLAWDDDRVPDAPMELEVFKTRDNLICIRWQHPATETDLSYTVYISQKDDFDLEKPESIIATRLKKNEIFLKPEEYDEGMYYTVTASDRFHKESDPIYSAFFIYSEIDR